MPMHESLPVKVTLTVEVDGHVLTFDQTGKATGARYHGEAPPQHYADATIEGNVRAAVDTCAVTALRQANELIRRMYPVTTR